MTFVSHADCRLMTVTPAGVTSPASSNSALRSVVNRTGAAVNGCSRRWMGAARDNYVVWCIGLHRSVCVVMGFPLGNRLFLRYLLQFVWVLVRSPTFLTAF